MSRHAGTNCQVAYANSKESHGVLKNAPYGVERHVLSRPVYLVAIVLLME